MTIKVKSARHGLVAPGKSGYGRLVQDLRRVGDFTRAATAAGMYAAMQPVMLDAKARAPKDTLALSASGYVTEPRTGSQRITVESGFGGDSEPYLVRVHEDPGFAKTGETYFFRNALDAGHQLIRDTIVSFVRRFLKTGTVPPSAAKEVPTSPDEDHTRQPSRF
jgi:hypothetical protein